MYVTAGSPQALIKVIEAPRMYDPRRPQEQGNRALDKSHIAGIVRYLEQERDFVIGATTLYVRPGVVRFESLDGDADRSAQLGYVVVPIDARFTIGDGQHRLRAYEEVLTSRREDEHDPILVNLKNSGTPAIIVEESDPAKTAQDFVDLQRNVKPLSSSLGAALDRRWSVNRFAMDLAKNVGLLKGDAVGDRIEYLSPNLSKLSPKLYTFASWRFAMGTLLIGFGQRTRQKWEQEAERVLAGRYEQCVTDTTDYLDAAARRLPGWRDVLIGESAVPAFREQFVLGTAAGLNAFAGASHAVVEKNMNRITALDAMAEVDWRKQKTADEKGRVFFDGTIVNNGKVQSSRTAFEPAAKALLDHVAKADRRAKPAPMPAAVA
jgi:DGQHR domain-containing protein